MPESHPRQDRFVTLYEIDERLQRYRLVQPKLERQMTQSLKDYGQVSPIIVCELEGKTVLVDGFKRLHAARCLKGFTQLNASAQLLEDLTSAAGDKSLPARVRYYRSFELLIIDEFGFDKLERREYPESPSLLYKVVDARSGRGSTAFITNVDFSQWTDYLDDPPLVMALLDRVVDSAIVVRFDGKSYRQHRAEQKQSSGSKRSQPSS